MKLTEFDIIRSRNSLANRGIENPSLNEIAFEFVREGRNAKLSATDWWCVSDRTATPEQIAYRQALRDLPANAAPALDENGNLTGVEWPTKPE